MITLIDKTVPLPPILTYHEKPVFKSTLEKQRYYYKQKELWINGDGEIAGTLIHKTQEQKIKHRNTGVIFRPECRDVDLLIHSEIDKSRKAGEALVIIKGRGIGLSCEMGCLANYFMRVYAGSTSLFTSSEQSKISALFSEKVMTTFNNYDEDIRPTIKRLNDTKNSVYLKAEVRSRDSDGKEFTADSEIYCKQTADSDIDASGFSGKGAIFGAYDELFLHKRRHLLLKSSSSCYIEQGTGKVLGFLLAGGSVEETLTNEEIGQLQKLIEDVQKHGRLGTIPARLLFIPASWGKFMTNGHSDHKKAEEWWEKEMEALSKLEDQSVARAFRMNNPMTLQDIFDLASGSYFEDDVIDKIKLTLETCKAEEVPHHVVMMGDKVEASPAKTGKIFIVEHPKSNVDYFQTIDGVAAGSNSGQGDSKVASIMWKGFDPNGGSYCPVAFYYEQPKSIEQSYVYSVNMCHYYNKFGGFKKIAAEGNAATGDHLSTYLEKEGLKKWIMYRKDLSGKGHSNTKKFFQYVTNDVRDWQIKQFNMILRKYVHNFQSKTILRDYLKGIEDNADLRDSSLMCPVYLGADFDKIVEKPKPRTRQRPVIEMVNGKSRMVWKTYTTQQKEEDKVEQEEEILHSTKTTAKFNFNKLKR